MTQELDTGYLCELCKQPIQMNEPMWTVTLHLEKMNESRITDVLAADLKKVYCETCGEQFDFDNIEVPQKSSN